jgi:arylsulfatase A-like enzyme
MDSPRSGRAAVWILVAASVAGAAAAYFAWSGGRREPDAPRAPYRNVVLLCIDTLRADALSAYGGDGRMPGLDRFAASSTVFLDASSHSAWTLPSITSMLTGLEPSHHGIVGSSTGPLLPQVVSLARVLKDAGYATAAITGGGWITPEHGLTRGFDSFSTEFDLHSPETIVSTWDASRAPGRPYFLFLHSYAAHDPYGVKYPVPALSPDGERRLAALGRRLSEAVDAGAAPSEDDLEEQGVTFLTKGAERAAFGRIVDVPHRESIWNLFLRWIDGGYAREPVRRARVEAALRDSYRDALPHVDGVMARTLAALDALPGRDDTLVIVCADHGEAFGEHRVLVHGRWLFDELVRVPLLVRAPKAMKPGTVRGSCGLADVFPTVLALTGTTVSAPIDARSLLPLAAGTERGRPVVAEERRTRQNSGTGVDAEVTSVRTERAKYVITRDPRGTTLSEELYDLVADPGETTSLPVERVDDFGRDFCATARAVRAAPRHAPRPGAPPDASGCR